MPTAEKIDILNVLQPGKTYRADKAKFEAMKTAMLKVLPKKPPGLTVDELQTAVLKHLPEALFPGGEKAGWWVKAVQLDLEARKKVMRLKTKPLTLHQV
jgi:hypothetical protein